MKITIATGIYPPEIGGPATYLRELVPILKKAGWSVDVITYGEPRKDAVTVPREAMFRWWKFFRATVESARDSDLIFATDTVSAGFPAAMAARWLKKRLITRFVGDFAWETARNEGWTTDPFEVFQKNKYSFQVELLRKIQNLVLRHSEIITVSNFLKSVLKRWGFYDVIVIPNIVCQLKLPSKEELRKKFGFGKNLVILSVGRITAYKGVDKIIRMCSKLRKETPNLLLVVIGDGPTLDEAKHVANEEIISHLVKFMGRLDELETRKYMKAADVLVLNSEYEGMSHTLLEAMSVQCPVVASNVCGNPVLVKNRGLLFEYNDMDDLNQNILKLYLDKKLCKKLVEKAFKDLPKLEDFEKKTLQVLRG